MANTRETAKGKWRGILIQLGTEQKFLTGKHGPCPMCGGKDRFRYDDKLQAGNWICGQCGHGDGFELLMNLNGWDFKTAAAEVDKIVSNVTQEKPKPKRDPKIRLRQVGGDLVRITAKDPVSLYLRNRGLTGIAGYGLRLHPALGYFDGRTHLGNFPAMVAKIENAQGGIESFHTTYLTADGNKANVPAQKKIMAPVNTINGGAIRLAPVAEHIAITEGIESALAVMEGEGLPCWACVSAHGIESFQPPVEVKRISIFADNDANFTGQAAAFVLAKRLSAEGYVVDMNVSPVIGTDYLDLLVKSRRAAA